MHLGPRWAPAVDCLQGLLRGIESRHLYARNGSGPADQLGRKESFAIDFPAGCGRVTGDEGRAVNRRFGLRMTGC